MATTPHLDKLVAAIANPKCADDRGLLEDARKLYDTWTRRCQELRSQGRERADDMTRLLNDYKDAFEVELVMKRGSDFLRRQKGQLKLDNSIIEEFLVRLICPEIIGGIAGMPFVTGPQKTFMTLAFRPRSLKELLAKPEVALKTKDQDFVIGSHVHYRFSSDASFAGKSTTSGSLVLAVVAAECKTNLDKTMFQEAAATATRLKMGCPVAKYFVLVEYLDMIPEDTRLTDIDNVLLLRRARRLPVDRRGDVASVEAQHKESPVAADLVWRFVEEIQSFVNATWYDPDQALKRGAFA